MDIALQEDLSLFCNALSVFNLNADAGIHYPRNTQFIPWSNTVIVLDICKWTGYIK